MPGRPVTPQDEEQISNLKFTAECANGQPLEITPRLDAFARRWARRWVRLYGSLPAHDHPFPNYWQISFIIDYGSRPRTVDSRA
jgi:hypothetical protein